MVTGVVCHTFHSSDLKNLPPAKNKHSKLNLSAKGGLTSITQTNKFSSGNIFPAWAFIFLCRLYLKRYSGKKQRINGAFIPLYPAGKLYPGMRGGTAIPGNGYPGNDTAAL
jgi:hypothetical protein